jgi:iron complex outermembrane recepter protein
MKPTKYLIVFFLFLVSVTHAQYRFEGTVKNAWSTPLAGATVSILNYNRQAVTDSLGRFTFNNINRRNVEFQISAIGYSTVTASADLTNSGPVNINLETAFTRLSEVVLSAQKNDERDVTIPFSVSSIGRDEVRSFRLWNIREISGIVPNLYSANPGDNRNVTSIRGIATTSYEPAVATYIDGVNQFGLDTYIAQLFDVDRIEVLRGPQGTIYGRNAMGGVINIVTSRPRNKPEAYLEVNAGNFNQRRFQAAVRLPVIKDKLYFGAAAVHEGRDGYFENEFNGKSFDDIKQTSGNYFLRFMPSDNWAISVNAKHHHNRNNGTFPLVQGIETAFENPYKLNQNATTRMIDNTVNGSISVTHYRKGVTFNSQTTFQKNHRHYESPIDADFSPLDAIVLINNYGNDWNNVRVWTQEFRIESANTMPGTRRWTAGTYLFDQRSPVKQATYFGRDAGLLMVPDSFFSIINTSVSKGRGIAFFGQYTYPLTKKLEIVAGVRYDSERRTQSALSEYQKDPDPQPQFPIIPDTSAEASFSAFSPKAGITYYVNDDQMLYLTYSRGFRAGGLTPVSQDPSQPALFGYDPEYSNNFEIGYKSSFFNSKLNLQVAAFYNTVTNAQVPTLVLPEAVTIIRNAGKLRNTGFELTARAIPTKGLTAGYQFGFTNSRFTNLFVSSGGEEKDYTGNKQIFTPEQTSSLQLEYKFDIREGKWLPFVRLEWVHLGNHYFDLANNIKQGAYHLLNARVGIETPYADLMLWANNITETVYVDYAYDFGAVHLGTPRLIGFTLSRRF